MKSTLPRGFQIQRCAPSLRSAAKKEFDLKFESKKLAANYPRHNTPHQQARQGRCEKQIKPAVRSVKENRH